MNGRFRLNRRRILLISLVLLLALVLGSVQLSPFGVRAARAASRLATSSLPLSAVPAAGIDDQYNRYVFWRGVDASHGLWEGFYQASIITWHGPISIPGMGPLGSEPTVAVDPGYVSSEYDFQYAYQFVFWQGADANHGLWEAYWDGSWHGPINLGMGSLGSMPSATYDAYKGILTVVWKGRDGNLWYTYNQLSFGQQQSWHGPFSAAWGPLGGPPTAADAGSGYVQAFWRGPMATCGMGRYRQEALPCLAPDN